MTLSVIGAGLGRTGTKSLKLALEQLGFGPCYHMVEVGPDPKAPGRWTDAAEGRPDWEAIFQGYRATVDWPGATFYRELAEAYPDAKVILSVRDAKAWFASTQATIFRPGSAPAIDSPMGHMFRKVIYDMFDGRIHDEAHAVAVYERHNAQVQATIASERLLVYEVSQGWGPLCGFLDVATPDAPMPNVNSREDFLARAAQRAQAQASSSMSQ